MPIWASSGRAACDAARYLRPRPHQRRDAGLFDRTLPRRARGRLGRLRRAAHPAREEGRPRAVERRAAAASLALSRDALLAVDRARDQPRQGAARPSRGAVDRSEEHTSELQSLMRISYAVFCLKKKKSTINKMYI